uniref:Uncharacterized protein n=1 Tax=Kalanchoe fedtschenkoi TaxID=63787 RepID=A0A7N0V3E3_KALFE
MQGPPETKKAGVHTYVAQWRIYSMAWSTRRHHHRLAIGSFLEDYSNRVELLKFNPDTSSVFSTDSRLVFDHPYAPTNLSFFPSEDPSNPDLIATSGDFIRLWEIHDDRIELKSLLNGNKSEFNSAITSFDWAEFDTRRIATCSVDTTCTIWDVEREAVDAQLVAHDKEVFDISWGGVNVFASGSGDGSVRVFDLRDKERSTIIYENPSSGNPMMRVEWNKADPRFIAAVGMDSPTVVIMDIRFPTAPMMELRKHKRSVNGVAWSPRAGRHVCSVGDDARALIWEVVQGGGLEPSMWYGTTAEINNVRWSAQDLGWIAIAFADKLQLLRI